MNKILLVLVLVLLCRSSFSQKKETNYASGLQAIFDHYDEDEYYDAIIEIDTLLKRYPMEARLYYIRGYINYKMNDFEVASKDMQQAKSLGYKDYNKFMSRVISNEYMVNLLTKYYYYDTLKLSADNNYKVHYGLKDSLQGALRPERTCFDVYFYDLTVKIIPAEKSIEGENKIYFTTTTTTDEIQIDLTENLQINSIEWNNTKLEYKRIYNAIFIRFPQKLNENENQLITIRYDGKPRIAPDPPWNGGFVWEKKRGHWWVGVACEHLGASSWWPCKDHLTEKPDSMRINIQVPSKYQAVSNGNLRSTTTLAHNYTNFEWFVSYPINSYGVTFYMGKFVNFNEIFTNEKGSYPIDYYVLSQHLTKAKQYYCNTRDIVEVYEKLFGEYPYSNDGMAMVESPYEGMEHQSAIAIGDVYSEKSQKDYNFRDYKYLVIHEMAHEWWGNTVTMSDMADAWISEGFATYAEHLFMEEKYGYDEYLNASAYNMHYILNIWPVVGIPDVNDNTFLSGNIYTKGAATLNNLRCTLNNDSLFFAMIKGFYSEFSFKTITTTDFVEFVNNYTGQDFTDFFNKFLYETDPPVLEYSFTNEDKLLHFNYKWINVDSNFTMPFSIMINKYQNIRLVGTSKNKMVRVTNTDSFYLPNEKRFNHKKLRPNSFTYYWTHWVKPEEQKDEVE